MAYKDRSLNTPDRASILVFTPYGRRIIYATDDARTTTQVLGADTEAAVSKSLVVIPRVGGLWWTLSTGRSPALSRARLFCQRSLLNSSRALYTQVRLLVQIHGRATDWDSCAASKLQLSWGLHAF